MRIRIQHITPRNDMKILPKHLFLLLWGSQVAGSMPNSTAGPCSLISLYPLFDKSVEAKRHHKQSQASNPPFNDVASLSAGLGT